MTSQQVGLLFIQLVTSVGVSMLVGMLLIRNHDSKQRYKLFAIRDRFLFLAATGVLPQNSMVFKVFYGAMNAYISELDSVTILSFLRASLALKTELEKQNKERLVESLRRSDQEVQAAVDALFHAVMDALRYNSPMLSMMLVFARHSTRLFQSFRPFPHPPIYDTYRYYEGIHGALGLA